LVFLITRTLINRSTSFPIYIKEPLPTSIAIPSLATPKLSTFLAPMTGREIVLYGVDKPIPLSIISP
jgi:hypothetical protein